MLTFLVEVTQTVSVTLDNTKFDEKFMEGFRESFYPFYELKDHAEHIAQLMAREVMYGDDPKEFVEGYGPIGEMGISAKTGSIDFYTIESE